MKKLLAILVALTLCLGCTALAAEGPFVPGEDAAEYVVDGASGWNTETAYVKIVAGDEVLYNGTITLTSDNLTVAEFSYAAISEVGCGCDGMLEGFVNSIGEYVSGNDADGNYLYWGYTVNGKYVPVATNQMTVLEGDYIYWEFIKYDPEAGFSAEELPCGFDAPFEVGDETTEYTVDGASGWNTEEVYVKISAGDDVIFNGTVTLTSDNLTAAEASFAAVNEAGVGCDGMLEGFVNSIGEYVSGNDADGNYIYWGYSINGKYTPFGCNQAIVLNHDYIEWQLMVYSAQ